MDEAAIGSQLDTALLSDEEMVKYRANYARTPDPPHPNISKAAQGTAATAAS